MSKVLTRKEYKEVKKMFKASLPVRVGKHIFNLALVGEIIVMLVFVILLVVPTFASIFPYTIITQSMTPKIPAGSLVYVNESLDNSLYQINDVIAFTEPGAAYPIVHRVQSVEDGYYITKGDANNRTEDVGFDQVIGLEVFSIPKLGAFCADVMPYKFLFVAIAFGTAVMMFVFSGIQSHQEQKKRREYLETVVEKEAAEEAAKASASKETIDIETPDETVVKATEKVED